MRSERNPSEYHPNENVFRWVSGLLISAMMACAALTAGALINRLLPEWISWIMAAVVFIIVLDSLYTRQRMKHLTFLDSSRLVVTGTQFVVIFLLVKVATSLSHGVQSFLTEIPLWGRDFIQYFITFDLIIGLAMAVAAWFIGSYFGELLDAIGFEQALIDQSIEVPDHRSLPQARDQMLSLVFSILIILVMITALVRVDLKEVFSLSGGRLFFQMPPLAGGGASTLGFFMFGLALLSQTQFISLHTHWGLAQTPVSGNLAGRWALYSIIFLLLLAAITAVLPTHYSLNFLSSLGDVLEYLLSVLFFIAQAIFSLIALLVNLPFLLIGQEAPLEINASPSQGTPPPPSPEPGEAASVPWLGMARSILFWVFFLGMVIFALSQYLRQHEEILAGLRRIPGWTFLARIRRWFLSLFAGMGREISRLVEKGRARISALGPDRRFRAWGGYINPRRLSPRQKVYFYYLAFIRRGGEQGIPRQPAQTPAEYARTLDKALPTAEEDIDQLTEAFIEARYSRHAVKHEDADRVKTIWERIRGVLRGKNKSQSG